MDIYSITELALKYIKCIMKKAIMLILRSWYLIMLFFVILFSLIIVLISFVYRQIADIYCSPRLKLRNNWHITLYKFKVYSILI